MKFLALHTGSKNHITKLLINPYGLVYAKFTMENGYNSIVMAGGSGFPVYETVDEVEKKANECLENDNVKEGVLQ